MKHTIRTKDGGLKEVDIQRTQAIKAFCTECMGFETHPEKCADSHCALFPFRGKTNLAYSEE